MNTMKQTIILLLVAVLLAATMTPVALAAEVCYPTAVEQNGKCPRGPDPA